MSFFTALTGLKGAQTEISTTSNNIANVGSNGFKKSRTDFGDIWNDTFANKHYRHWSTGEVDCSDALTGQYRAINKHP